MSSSHCILFIDDLVHLYSSFELINFLIKIILYFFLIYKFLQIYKYSILISKVYHNILIDQFHDHDPV